MEAPLFGTCTQQCATQYAPDCDSDEKILERCFGITPIWIVQAAQADRRKTTQGDVSQADGGGRFSFEVSLMFGLQIRFP
jgi:hypothetical protein